LLFRDGVAQYLDMQEKRLRPASFKNCKLYLVSPKYFGNLHGMPVNEITRSHVSTAIDKITSRGTSVTASRCRAWLSGFFVWCLERGHAESNPVIDSATVQAAPPRDRVLSDDELRKVWNACGDDSFGKIVRLLILTGCRIHGVSAWRLTLDGATKQQNLVITTPFESEITVDNIEVAQFVYLLLNNEKIRDVIETVTSKAVLILGRFTAERKAVLDALRKELRKHDYLPILFDFDKPTSQTTDETITLLARMSRFVIADISDAKSVLQELRAIVPDLP
jgi:hypothetical protein